MHSIDVGEEPPRSVKAKSKLVNFSTVNGSSVSLTLPRSWIKYLPKIDYTRPGNIIMMFVVFLVILILSISVTEARELGHCDPGTIKLLNTNILRGNCSIYSDVFFTTSGPCLVDSSCEKGRLTSLGSCAGEVPVRSVCGSPMVSSYAEVEKPRYDWLSNEYPADLCSIEKYVIKDCKDTFSRRQEVHIVTLGNELSVLLDDVLVTVNYPFKNLSMYSCHPVHRANCIGDETYENHFPANERSSDCECKWNGSESKLISLTHKAETHFVDSIIRKTVTITHSKDYNDYKKCIDCDVSCKGGTVKLSSNGEITYSEICAQGYCEDMEGKDEFDIPVNFISLGNRFKISMITNEHTVLQRSVTCEIKDVCDLTKCTLCYSKIANPQCFTLYDKVTLLVGFCIWIAAISVIAKVLKLVSIAIVGVLGFLKGLFWLLKSLFRFSLLIVGKKLITSKEKIVKTISLEDGSVSETTREIKRHHIVQRESLSNKLKKAGFGVLLMSHLASSCSESVTIGGTALRCSQYKGGMSCKTLNTVELALSPVGQESCLMLTYPDGRTKGLIRIKIEGIQLACAKESLFWTFNPGFYTKQNCYCKWTAECTEDQCNDSEKNAKFSKSRTALKKEGCAFADGGWSNGCFVSTPKCCYYSAVIYPGVASAYEVFRCSSYYWKVPVTITTTNHTSVSRETALLIPGESYKFTFGHLKIKSVSIPPMPILNKCFVYRTLDKAMSYTDCSSDSFSPGQLGDVRCDSESTARYAKASGCTVSEGAVWHERRQGNLVIRSKLYNIDSLFIKQLPIRSQGYKIMHDEDSTVYGEVSSNSALSMMIDVENLKVAGYTETMVCRSKFISMTGCTNCITGAVMTLTIKSERDAVPFKMTCPSLISPVLGVTSIHSEKVELRGHFKMSKISESCTITCPDSVEDVTISGKLLSDIKIPKDTTMDYWEFINEAGKFFTGISLDWGWYFGGTLTVIIIVISVYMFWSFFSQFRTKTYKKIN